MHFEDADSPKKYPTSEWDARCNLAALYRIAAIHGMSDLIYNHISLRTPDEPDSLLINSFGSLFNEITASSLVKIDYSGNIIAAPLPNCRVNRAGVVIHTAVHEARPELTCVIHSHTTAGMAVSAQRGGLLPITQHAMMFYERVGYHDYESFANQEEERERIAKDLGRNDVLILRNHGVLVGGRSVGEAFHNAYHLERACQAQIMAQSSRQLNFPPEEIARKTSERMAAIPTEHFDFFWQQCLHLLPDGGEDCRR